MKRLITVLSLAAAAAALTACAGGGPFGEGATHYAQGATYKAYYDNFYGPVYDGYWTGGAFNYRTASNHPFQQDTGGHFRRDPATGFSEIQGEMHPGMPSGAVGSPNAQQGGQPQP